ncbi:MAG: hypothetical protein WBJ62_01375 [Coriobacteriia bacterium]
MQYYCRAANRADARRDVAPFLEQPRNLAFIEAATFTQLLGGA